MAFADNLRTIAPAGHLERIELLRDGTTVAVIENRPGQAGSLAVYHHLLQRFGSIGPEAAAAGLELYAEHTADARRNPGKHPNIDRLLAIVDGGPPLTGRAVARAAGD